MTDVIFPQKMNDYLKNINFREDDVKKGIRAYLKNMRIVSLLVIGLIIGGFVSYKSLPQTVAPEINLTMLVVSAALPGAIPEDVESLLTIPLEDELRAVDGIDTVEASAGSGSTSIVMTFTRGVDKNRALADVEAALGRVGELPEDATEPRVVAVDFEDAPIVRWTFAANEESSTSLLIKMQKLIDSLESDQKIDRVISGGKPKQEVQIIITQQALSTYGIGVGDVHAAVASGVLTLPSGVLKGVSLERSLSIDASVDSIDDLRNLPLSLPESAQIITLGDIAAIIERPAPGTPDAYIFKDDTAKKIVTLDVYRTTGVDITDAVEKAQAITDEFMETSGKGLMRYETFNADTELSDQFNELMRNLSATVLLVFVTLTLFVGRRQALLASISIPLIYAITFIAMRFTGISVNFLSLFSLTISLGLLVDVTIVIVSAMTTYMRDGSFGAHKTGILVFRDFFVTLIMTTLTTVWAFVPLLLAGGIIGEYIKPIPVVVSSVLAASVLVGFFVILPLMIWLFDFSLPKRVLVFLRFLIFVGILGFFAQGMMLPLPLAVTAAVAFSLVLGSGRLLLIKWKESRRVKKIAAGKDMAVRDVPQTIINISALQARYQHILENILATKAARYKTIGMVAVFFIFACSLVAMGFVKNEFFPGGDNNILFVEVDLPDGTTVGEAKQKTQELLPQLGAVEGVSYVTMQIGFGTNNDGGTSKTGNDSVLFTLKTPEKKDGGRGAKVIAQELRSAQFISAFRGGEIAVVEQEGGPPAGADVTITFRGDELPVLQDLANTLKNTLETSSQEYLVENLEITPAVAAATIAFEPNDHLLKREGITRGEISSTLRLLTTGITLQDDVEFTGFTDKRDIVLRMNEKEASLADIGQIHIAGKNGPVPIDALGSITLKENITNINREDFDRTVSVTASVKEEGNIGEVNSAIGTLIDEQINLPAGYTWKTGGANEENNESVVAIIQGMGLAAALIFLTLIIHLRSYRKAAIVLMTVPLAISGVFIIFGIIGIPLSFPSLIGLLALFGIVVNNAIIIISQINANRDVGISFHESVISGATSRLEPILLSSLTTIIGLLPITLSDPIWQGLGGAIIAGLMFSGVIMLFFIPTLYYIMMSDEDVERIA